VRQACFIAVDLTCLVTLHNVLSIKYNFMRNMLELLFVSHFYVCDRILRHQRLYICTLGLKISVL